MNNKELLQLNDYLNRINELLSKSQLTLEETEELETLKSKIDDFYPKNLLINIFNVAFLEIDNISHNSTNYYQNTSKILLELYELPTTDVNKIETLTNLTHTLINARLNHSLLTQEEIDENNNEQKEKPLIRELKKEANN